eukprot:CAMPEP_0168315300 /NCGR_PEP_ID=MMETSP0210-20121227/10770_1 /TAXON_ID=40633 /ORGANISM="Condylostoma magnum, Strain COL2" /LENGTH=74 /DNA_ID=CAMNT_0008287653 /DNA_START=403 /DNA_END=624 /DNA_ORIENTATION=-
MSAGEVTEKLGLHGIRGRQWYLQSTCATGGDGLYEGLDWLSRTLSGRGDGLYEGLDWLSRTLSGRGDGLYEGLD